MSTHAPADPPKRRGLLRVFVAFSVALATLLIVVVVLTVVTFASASTAHEQRTFKAVDRLRIHSGGGDVTILGERRDDIRVDVEIRRDMWRNDWEPKMQLRDGNLLRLDSDCSVWSFIGGGTCGASFTVHVPHTIATAVIEGGSSDVRIDRLAARIDVSTGSGDVEANDVAGPLAIDVGSGDVDVDQYLGTVVTAKAGSGDIELRSRRAPRTLSAETGSGDVTIAVPDVGYRIDVDTGSGDEDVQVEHDPHAKRAIVARTGSGDVSIFPGD